MADVTSIIDEIVVEGRRLGRHLWHDAASLAFPAEKAKKLVDVLHERHVPPFDQGSLGSCTGNAMCGLMVTSPVYDVRQLRLSEVDCVDLYEVATTIDPYPGSYPPDDTGSSGLAVAKAAKRKGWIDSYRHAFGLDHALRALALRPVITGVPWYEGFDNPDKNGIVKISGKVRGGHEFVVVGINVAAKRVRAWNSWGDSYGDGGAFEFSWDDWDRLLHEQGDVTTVHLAAAA